MDEALKGLISSFELRSYTEFTKKIEKFLAKGDSDFKRTLLRAIHIYAGHQKDKNTEKLVIDL